MQTGIKVDWRRPGPFTTEERAQIARWYGELHGEGNLDLSRFLTFWLKHDEAVFKRYRRLLEASFVSGAPSENVSFLLFLHSYVIEGYEPGVLYEVIGCQRTGVTKKQVIDAISLAYIHAGPMGMNGIASGTDAYLDKWTSEPHYSGQVWPDGWVVDGDVFKSGLDFSSPGMSDDEIAKLGEWYRKNQGEIPSYVPFLAKRNPEALKAFRARYEGAVNTLPKQLIPLMMFHSAAMKQAEGAMRRYAFQAKCYGATKAQLIEAITFLLMYTGDLTSEIMTNAVEDIVAGWD